MGPYFILQVNSQIIVLSFKTHIYTHVNNTFITKDFFLTHGLESHDMNLRKCSLFFHVFVLLHLKAELTTSIPHVIALRITVLHRCCVGGFCWFFLFAFFFTN